MGNIFRSKMKKICDKIYDKICNKAILDSEIIRAIECAKREYPKFDINYVECDWSWSLLMVAVGQDRRELIEYFLKDPDINVNYKNSNDYTALGFAYRVPILKSLFNRQDLDVNMQDNDGNTLLYKRCNYSSNYNNSDNIIIVRELLLDARIDPSIRNNRGRTAWNNAVFWRQYRLANMIKKVLRTPLLRIPNNMLLYDIVRMIIEKY